MTFPTIVSFYGGDRYYYDAAEQLAQDCDRFGLDHDIVEVQKPEGGDWADLCRMKIPFYRDMLDRHPGGIMWVDVDSRFFRRPDELRLGGHDFAAFLRGGRAFREYDPVVLGRKFIPGLVQFSGTDRARQFVDFIAELEAKETAIRATDDYFLEEGIRNFPEPLGIHVLRSDLLASSAEEAQDRPETCLMFGLSGNVRDFIGQVQQHEVDYFEAEREKAVLIRHARNSQRKRRPEAMISFLAAALELDPSDSAVAVSLARALMRHGRAAEANRILRRAVDPRTTDFEAQLALADIALSLGNSTAALNALRRMKPVEAKDKAVQASRQFRVDLDRRAEAAGLKESDRPALWWMETPYPGNFGDVLNPYVVEKLSGLPPRYVDKGEGILAIGSVIKFARSGTKVWGTGTPRMTDVLAPDAEYRAVRGPLTRELVLQSGGSAPELYGDAAMLLPLIYTPKPARRRHRLGIIFHSAHKGSGVAVADDVLQIDPELVGYNAIEQFIDAVASCDAIISTSLHGLIVANAYDIPARHAVISEDDESISGDGTKFRDHALACGIALQPPLDLSKLTGPVTAALADGSFDRVQHWPKYFDLLEAAPLPVLPLYKERAREFRPALAISA